MIVGWKIWYTNNRVYSSHDITWEELPDDGVLFLILYRDQTYMDNGVEKRYRTRLHAYDWYGSDGDQMFMGNNDSLPRNKQRYPGLMFKEGIWVSDTEFSRIEQYINENEFNFIP